MFRKKKEVPEELVARSEIYSKTSVSKNFIAVILPINSGLTLLNCIARDFGGPTEKWRSMMSKFKLSALVNFFQKPCSTISDRNTYIENDFLLIPTLVQDVTENRVKLNGVWWLFRMNNGKHPVKRQPVRVVDRIGLTLILSPEPDR